MLEEALLRRIEKIVVTGILIAYIVQLGEWNDGQKYQGLLHSAYIS
jgi:hypothetical protein